MKGPEVYSEVTVYIIIKVYTLKMIHSYIRIYDMYVNLVNIKRESLYKILSCTINFFLLGIFNLFLIAKKYAFGFVNFYN